MILLAVMISSPVLKVGCSASECDILISRAESPGGRFYLDTYRGGSCGGAVGTTVTDVVIQDSEGWIRKSRTVFTISRAAKVQVSWSGPRSVNISYQITNAHEQQVYRREERWKDVSILYDSSFY